VKISPHPARSDERQFGQKSIADQTAQIYLRKNA
jgi:hypothetical protein